MEETVVQAIRAVHAPNTSIQQRQKAGNYLEQIKMIHKLVQNQYLYLQLVLEMI